MKKRDQEHRKELMDIELRLSAAERQIEELVKVNQKLSDANQRYENFIKWIKGELSRLANVEPDKFPKRDGIPDFTKEH